MQRITSLSDYFKKYEQSVKDPEKFWAEIADTFIWKKSGIRYWIGILIV